MKCPTCKRKHRGDHDICKRCGTDLSDLILIEKAKHVFTIQGLRYLQEENAEDALVNFAEALKISQNDIIAHRGLALANLMKCQYRDALGYYLKAAKKQLERR